MHDHLKILLIPFFVGWCLLCNIVNWFSRKSCFAQGFSWLPSWPQLFWSCSVLCECNIWTDSAVCSWPVLVHFQIAYAFHRVWECILYEGKMSSITSFVSWITAVLPPVSRQAMRPCSVNCQPAPLFSPVSQTRAAPSSFCTSVLSSLVWPGMAVLK